MSSPDHWRVPTWAGRLCNLYWRLRNLREFDSAGRRKFYRYIRAERDYLIERGVDAELLRLACRHLSFPNLSDRRAQPALSRLVAFEQTVYALAQVKGTIELYSSFRSRAGLPILCDVPRCYRTKKLIASLTV